MGREKTERRRHIKRLGKEKNKYSKQQRREEREMAMF